MYVELNADTVDVTIWAPFDSENDVGAALFKLVENTEAVAASSELLKTNEVCKVWVELTADTVDVTISASFNAESEVTSKMFELLENAEVVAARAELLKITEFCKVWIDLSADMVDVRLLPLFDAESDIGCASLELIDSAKAVAA